MPGTIALSASVTSPIPVSHVIFYDGSNAIAGDWSAPFSVSYYGPGWGKGPHVITAKAFNATGSVTSAPIILTVP